MAKGSASGSKAVMFLAALLTTAGCGKPAETPAPAVVEPAAVEPAAVDASKTGPAQSSEEPPQATISGEGPPAPSPEEEKITQAVADLDRGEAEYLRLLRAGERDPARKVAGETVNRHINRPIKKMDPRIALAIGRILTRLAGTGWVPDEESRRPEIDQAKSFLKRGGVDDKDMRSVFDGIAKETRAAIVEGDREQDRKLLERAKVHLEAPKPGSALEGALKLLAEVQKREPESTKRAKDNIPKLDAGTAIRVKLVLESEESLRAVVGERNETGARIMDLAGFQDFVTTRLASDALNDRMFRNLMEALNPKATAADIFKFARVWGGEFKERRDIAAELYLSRSPVPPEFQSLIRAVTK